MREGEGRTHDQAYNRQPVLPRLRQGFSRLVPSLLIKVILVVLRPYHEEEMTEKEVKNVKASTFDPQTYIYSGIGRGMRD